MKRFKTIRFMRREETPDQRERTILDYGDPITVQLTRELEDRNRRLRLGQSQPAAL